MALSINQSCSHSAFASLWVPVNISNTLSDVLKPSRCPWPTAYVYGLCSRRRLTSANLFAAPPSSVQVRSTDFPHFLYCSCYPSYSLHFIAFYVHGFTALSLLSSAQRTHSDDILFVYEHVPMIPSAGSGLVQRQICKSIAHAVKFTYERAHPGCFFIFVRLFYCPFTAVTFHVAVLCTLAMGFIFYDLLA